MEDLFFTEEEWEREYAQTEQDLDAYERYQGKLCEKPALLYEGLERMNELQKHLERLYVYANQRLPRRYGGTGSSSSLREGRRISW